MTKPNASSAPLTIQEERNVIDYETKLFLNRIKQMNAKLKHVQVTDVKIKLNEPAPVKAKMWWEVWK